MTSDSAKKVGSHENAASAASVHALILEITYAALEDIYKKTLEEKVFSDENIFKFSADPLRRENRRYQVSFEKTLKQSEARSVLTIIWQLSDHFSDVDIEHATNLFQSYNILQPKSYDTVGNEKRVVFGKDYRRFKHEFLTMYSISIFLSQNPREIAAVNSRVRRICITAEQYGLIERVKTTGIRGHIRATELLHRTMTEVGHRSKNLLKLVVGEIGLG